MSGNNIEQRNKHMRPVHVFNSQDLIFRQTTNLPPIGTEQKVPHELDFTVDASTDIWDVELERKLIDKGIWSHAVKVSSGQAIILPPDQYHCFKKIFSTQDDKGIPLVGLACDCTYVGHTEESFNSYYQSIKVITYDHLHDC
jgi:D-lyxose ketol-isomerase